jgi:hypothetical protein
MIFVLSFRCPDSRISTVHQYSCKESATDKGCFLLSHIRKLRAEVLENVRQVGCQDTHRAKHICASGSAVRIALTSAAASVIIVLLWVYYSACILFFGVEFTKVYARRFGSGIVPNNRAMLWSEAVRARLISEAR